MTAKTSPFAWLSLIRWRLWRDFLGRFGQARARIMLLAVLGTVQTLLVLPTLFLVRYCFDTAIPQRQPEMVVAIGCAILLIRLAASAVALLARLLSVRLAKATITRMRQDLIDWLYRAPHDYLARNDAARVQGRIVQETERLDNFSGTLLSALLPSILTVAVLLALLAWINWHLVLVAALMAPLAWAMALVAGRRVKTEVGVFQENFERFNRGVSFVVRQMALTRSRGHEAGEASTQARHVVELERSGVRMAMSFAAHGQLQSTTIGVIGIGVLVAGGLEVIAGHTTLGALIAFYLGANYLNGAMSQLTNVMPDVLACDESLARLEALHADEKHVPYVGSEIPRFTGVITLRDVRFSHGEAPLIDDLSLDLAPGCNVAIIGPNGVGKSTIVDLILGFYRPHAGMLLADGIPYEQLDLRALRRMIGHIPQRPTFFTGTVAENLSYGRPGCTRAGIVAAASRAGIDDFIRNLPGGYDTAIGEAGVLISGGEAQRLAIARALVGDPRLLIFDEPTNHLDATAIAAIMGRLLSADHRPGVLTITHDPAVVALADTVLRIERGGLVPGRLGSVPVSALAS